MNLATELYADQTVLWPREGRHILAHHDAETVIVYQAYRPSIAAHAIRHGVLERQTKAVAHGPLCGFLFDRRTRAPRRPEAQAEAPLARPAMDRPPGFSRENAAFARKMPPS